MATRVNGLRFLGAQIGGDPAISPAARVSDHPRRTARNAGMRAQVNVIGAAASDHVSELHLELNPFHPGDPKRGSHGLPLTLTTIDAHIETLQFTHVELIKIDVQGAEHWVLAGAEQTARQWRPVLCTEMYDVNLRRDGTRAALLMRELIGRSDRAHGLNKAGLTAPVDAVQACAQVAQGDYADRLFLPRERGQTAH